MKRRLRDLSLLWKILLSTTLALTLLFGVLGWIVQDQFIRIASATVEEEVRGGFHAYESIWNARAEQLASVSLVLSRMPDVRAAFNTRDQATIRDTAGEVWDKIGHRGALFLVADPNGTILAAVGAAGAGIRELTAVREAAAQFPKQATGFVTARGHLFQIVVTPVYVAASEGSALLNVVIDGIPIDTETARELKEATGGSDFVFRSGGVVVASTLTNREDDERGDFARFSTPLVDVGGRPIGELRILRSYDAARNRIRAVRRLIVSLWAMAVLIGFALTYALARRLLRPVQALDTAAAQIAEGNYDVEVEVQSRDEIGRLARTFNSMCASIRSAREELIHRERISTIGRLSTSIIHDLRNPLASIYGGAEMLVDGELTSAQVKRLAGNIYKASRRMQELLQELADISRGKSHAREMCGLREVVKAAGETVTATAVRQGVHLHVEIPDGIELPLDRSPMERVFQNLFGNAVEAMPGGGWVRASSRVVDDHVLITVEDNGPGIPDTLLRQLFQPFVSGGKKNGMGLGLALSRETVRDHDGELWAERTAAGARFVLRLPLRQSADA